MSNVGYLGLDLGGTSVKAVVYDACGRRHGVSHCAYTPCHSENGHAEIEIAEIESAAWQAVRQAAYQSDVIIRALAIASQGQTFVPLDASDRPVYPAVMWYDSRAAGEAKAMCEAVAALPPVLRPILSAITTGPKISWLHARFPEKMARVRRYLLLPDFFAFRLTGTAVTDPNTASSTGFYRDDAPGYCEAALAAAGVTVDQLAAIMPSGTPIGRVRPAVAEHWGLPADTTIVTGTNDQYAGAIGAGNTRPGVISETSGSCLALVALSETLPTALPDGIFTGRFPISRYHFALAFAKTAGLVIDWFTRECSPESDLEALTALAAHSPIGSHGLTMLPHFDGMVSPTPCPSARGHICNLTLGHTRGDLFRAILESLTFSLRENIELLQEQGFQAECIRSIGGGAKSDFWLQMKADVTGRPVERPAVTDAGALGAAILAAVGDGAFASIEEAAQAWVRIAHTFQPAPADTEQYQTPYERYRALCRTLSFQSSREDTREETHHGDDAY